MNAGLLGDARFFSCGKTGLGLGLSLSRHDMRIAVRRDPSPLKASTPLATPYSSGIEERYN